MNELTVNLLYMAHAIVIWAGSIQEIYHIFKGRSAKDVTVFWICCLLLSEVMALPRAWTSGYWVWWACHIGGVILLAVMLFGVVKYRK